MLLEDLREHLIVVQKALNEAKDGKVELMHDLLNDDSIHALNTILDKFKYWRPEMFIHVQKGFVQTVLSNCNSIVNLWDNDAEEMEGDSMEDFSRRKYEWEAMINSSLNDKTIKAVYP